MRLTAFRIKNFRSIIDTGWCTLSPDNITGFIGQNEAGKTAILDALYAFFTREIDKNDLRSDDSKPEVNCSFQLNADELSAMFPRMEIPKQLLKKLKEKNWRVNLKGSWSDLNSFLVALEEPDIKEIFDDIEPNVKDDESKSKAEKVLEKLEQIVPTQLVTELLFIEGIETSLPEVIFFQENYSLLPNTIDVEDLQAKKRATPGYYGALNFLTIAELDVDSLGVGDPRLFDAKIDRASQKITEDFRLFWQQQIGKSSKIELLCDLKHYDNNTAAKTGKPYLAFWIKDSEKLYPQQRSKGVIWFISFYLQLRASKLSTTDAGAIYLLDEPGGSLHAKAQKDVLRLFEDIKDNIQIIYTTHSPYLIEQTRLYRLLAIQRANDDDDNSPTQVLNINALSTASSETLSPVYTAMGIDFSHQNVIQKNNNVLLEELSAFYYLKAFWTLTKSSKKAYFLPANGASTIPQLANLFLGWGLNFLVVVDDDKAGRTTFNELKKNLYKDDANEADMKLVKIKDCDGIEDIFSKNIFKKYVMRDMSIEISGKNSAYIKSKGASKILAAVNFMLDVNNNLSLDKLDSETQTKIKALVEKIEERLS